MLEKFRNYLWKRRIKRLKRRDRLHRKRKHFLTRKKYDALLHDYHKLNDEICAEDKTNFVLHIILISVFTMVAVTGIALYMTHLLAFFAESLLISLSYLFG